MIATLDDTQVRPGTDHVPTPASRERAQAHAASPAAAHAAGDGPCRILLICDDQRNVARLREALGDELVVDQVLGEARERRLALEIDAVVLGAAVTVDLRERRYRLGIVATTATSPLLALAESPGLRAATAAMLYLVEAGFDPAAAGKERRPGDRVLPAPCTSQALRAEVERLLLAVLAGEPALPDDERCLSFLDGLLKRGQRTLRPLIMAGHCGHTYPDLAGHFGAGVNHAAILDRLTGLGICSRSLVQRLRSCPVCSSHQLAWSEACAQCGSPDFVRDSLIRHRTCGHQDTQAAFTRDGKLLCPKCGWSLREIGRDYDQPTSCYRCRECSTLAAEARVHARCLCCQTVSAPDQIGETPLHTYELTAKADEAVRADDLAGWHMASVLRNHDTGLYPKGFFLYTLERELDRRRQHRTPVSLVALHAGFLAALRMTSSARYGEQVQALWRAATAGLGSLDVPCVWEEGTVVILLPDTGLDGAAQLARDIQDAFVRDGRDVDEVPLVLVAIEAGDQHRDAEALVLDAVERLANGCATVSDVLVLEEEEAPV